MPFFQNVFQQEFRGNLVASDRQYSLTFNIPASGNGRFNQQSYYSGPYDLSVHNTFTIYFSYDGKNYSEIDINVAGAVPATTQAFEVVNALNANNTFSSNFTAYVNTDKTGHAYVAFRVTMNPPEKITFYIDNHGAEQLFKFNQRCGIAEIPSYFERHIIANANVFPDCQAAFIELDDTDPVDLAIIRNFLNNQSWTSADLKEDWELPRGRVGLFSFQKLAYDANVPPRVISIIYFPAGAQVGDLAKLTEYVYSGTSINVVQITETPYVLAGGDLITPP